MVTAAEKRVKHFAHPVRNVDVFGVEPGMTIADFGSGSGAYVLAIAEALEHFGRVYAVDIQRDLLKRTLNEATRKGLRVVEARWGDLEESEGSKLSKSSIDLVLVSNLLFQVADKPAVLREAKRILKPGGRLVIIDWAESFGGLGPIEKHVFTKDETLTLAESEGFALLKEFVAGAHHYGLIFRSTSAK